MLSDLRMPGIDGLELLPQIAKRLPGVAIILMSAFGSGDLAVEAEFVDGLPCFGGQLVALGASGAQDRDFHVQLFPFFMTWQRLRISCPPGPRARPPAG